VGVGVDGIRLEVGTVLQQGIEDVDGFPYTAGDEVAEQRDVGRRDVVLGDPAIAAVADVALAQKRLFSRSSTWVPSAMATFGRPHRSGSSKRA